MTPFTAFCIYSVSNPCPSYGTKIPPAVLAERVASYVHYFTLHGSLRPFGATALLASYDPSTKSSELHMIEPSGITYEYFGCAAGKGRQPAKTEMEKLSLGNKQMADGAQVIDVAEGVKQLARIIYLLHNDEAKDSAKPFELEMSWVCQASDFKHAGVPKKVIADAVAWAKADLEEEDDDEEQEEDMEE